MMGEKVDLLVGRLEKFEKEYGDGCSLVPGGL